MRKFHIIALLALLHAGTILADDAPGGKEYTISLPADANLALGIKKTHFTVFENVEPVRTEITGDTKKVTYSLAGNQTYNYRTWREGGLTQAGYFTMTSNPDRLPVLSFTEADYEAFAPGTIRHDVQWNKGYETGDILVNINERGHLRLQVGDTYEAHAMRTWQLTNNSVANYFMEPDFHYTVIDTEGNPSTGVIEIDNAHTGTDPWSLIRAVGRGTAIVLVTYDAIRVNYYSGPTRTPYMGGEYWSAIWPENTAAYVVTVGEEETSMQPNMVINEAYNDGAKKNAGKYVDAEHDVFYYLDTEEGCYYTFRPDGVENVEMAYPTIGERMATYTGFGTEGVTVNADGSYTLLLKEGRQIVRMTDASGHAAYQVLTAKSCHREITNVSREGSTTFHPGDKVKIQYTGLRHPANKLAGIYNMSAYVTYNGVPNGSSLVMGSSQYTFGSSAPAQAVTVDIPADYDAKTRPELVMSEGVVQVNGYGDPVGAHRLIDRTTGRSTNMSAVAHKTYFGMLPEVRIPVTDAEGNPEFDGIINFEDVDLGEAEFWNGADASGLFMTGGDYSFLNYYNEAYSSWCGFGVSRTTGTDYTGWGTPSEFNSCTGGGMESRQFAVGYFSEYNFLVDDQAPAIYATKAFRPKYVHINNSAQAYLSMLNGDEFSKKFTDEDFLLLTITGLTAEEEETGHVDFYLAKDGKIVNEWTRVDLTPLGVVDHIRFTMKSSDTSYGFMNTPAYFCLDNMDAELTDDVPTGIRDIVSGDSRQPSTGNHATGIYTIGGMKVNTLQRGVNIVRLPDGTTRKVMIR